MSRPALAAIALAALLTIAGTALWIAGILRPAPAMPVGRVQDAVLRSGVYGATVAVGSGLDGVDRAGGAVALLARDLAGGRLGDGGAVKTIDLRFAAGGRPLMRLLFDPGVLAAGAVAGGTPDHLLGLAGAGSRWPRRDDPAVLAYCGRMETLAKPFCTRVTGA